MTAFMVDDAWQSLKVAVAHRDGNFSLLSAVASSLNLRGSEWAALASPACSAYRTRAWLQ